MLKQPIYVEFNLDDKVSSSKLIAISHVDDKYSEVLEVAVKQNDRFVYMGGATVIARMVLHRDKDYLLSDDVACSVNSNGNILIPFDNAVVKTSQGVVKIEVNITRDTDELTLQFPLWVSVNGSILDNAEVTPESEGTIPDLLKDAADALEDATKALDRLGSYDNLEDKPQINGVTLSGNKTSGELRVVGREAAEIDNCIENGVLYSTSINDQAAEVLAKNITTDITQYAFCRDGRVMWRTRQAETQWQPAGEWSAWEEIGGGSQIVSGVVNQNGTITFTDSDGNTFTTSGASVIGPQGAPGNDYVLTAQDKADIAGMVDISGKADKATTLAGYGINDAYTKAEVDALNSAKVDKADYTEEVGDLKSALNGTVDLIGDTTIYNVSLAESGTGVGANWNLYYDKSLPKGTKLNFYLSAYTGVLFTNVLFRFYDTTNTLRNLTPSVMQTGKFQTYTLFEDCTRIWVQINRSAPENGVSAQFIMSFDTSGLSADVAKIQSALPTNTQEVLRSDILKNPGRRFKSDGTDEDAGGDTWVISDYIPVGNGLTVTGYSYSSTRPGIVEYNAAKTVLGAQSTASSSEYVTRTYAPPSAVAFVRIQTITSVGNDTSAISVINSAPKVFRVEKNGSGDFTKLSDAINEAIRYMDSTVYVGTGTWDLIDELGEDYINSVSSTQRGLYLKNRIHVICSSNSKITCNYTDSRSDTITWLSAFNAGPLGFTLENATIESSNCRYAIHDERDQDADEYNNYYINCKIKHDNTNGGYNQCIGGGLGLNGHVIIDGCIFENPARTNYKIVYYHNSAGSGKSFVEVKGSYFKGTNTLGFMWYGTSPANQKSTLFAHDNSLGSEIQHTGVSGATVENTEVISFNNEIRSNGAPGQD